MSRSRHSQTNFSSGVLGEEMLGRIDTSDYQNGLLQGKNILVNTTGGFSRRPGTLIMRNYGEVPYMRLFPFFFNRDQKYLIVMYLFEPDPIAAPGVYDGLIDIYKDNTMVVSAMLIPYTTKKQIESLDFAQSADIMVLTEADTQPMMLRRLGSDTDWDIVAVPFVNAPCSPTVCELTASPTSPTVQPTCPDSGMPICDTGLCHDDSTPTCPTDYNLRAKTDLWNAENGYPQLCTFHQGRLWFANCHSKPQSVWASVSQDFFNFDLGDQSHMYSIQETLDTDFINPITAIYSARKLQLFTRGSEFMNGADVITPTTSAWLRQTDYGSRELVKPIAVDGGTLFVDGTGRTVRNFVYQDQRGGYDAPSISAKAEQLIKEPVKMGTMRGSEIQASNFVYVVNSDGSMAMLNLSQAYKLAAWVEWDTQGYYQDVVSLDTDAFILVKRFVSDINGDLVLNWMLERVTQLSHVDSGVVKTSLQETSVEGVRKNEDNFFGVYYRADGRGKIVVLWNGVVQYMSEYLETDPLTPIRTATGAEFTSGNPFSTNDDIRRNYFGDEAGYQWYMYSIKKVNFVNYSKNYVDGLGHLLYQEVISVLDGNVYPAQQVLPAQGQDLVEAAYPDGVYWAYDDTPGNETWVMKETLGGSAVYYEGYYAGTYYPNLIATEYGLLVEGEVGAAGSKYLQIGNMVSESTPYTEVIMTASGSYNVPKGISTVTAQLCAGGGGGGGGGDGEDGTSHLVGEGGSAGKAGGASHTQTYTWALEPGEVLAVVVGGGGGGGSGTGGTGGTSSVTGVFINQSLGGAGGGAGGSTGDGHEFTGGEGDGSDTAPSGTYINSTYTGYGGTGVDGGDKDDDGDTGHGGARAGGGGSGGGGGGGGGLFSNGNGGGTGGGGGGGILILNYGVPYVTFIHETRVMELVPSTAAEGVITFPEDPFINSQSGLWYGVVAETMPLVPNAGAGSLVNEPKRIVSVTPHLINSQGVSFNGFFQHERQFSEETLDRPLPKLSGTEKIRFLGYNRKTTVVIIQNDPLPMTLLSLDIEVNY